MKDKKSLLVIIVAAIVVVFMIAAVVVVLKDSNHNSGEENNSSSENETTSENITEETKEETVEDLYQKFEEYYTEKDYAKALNYGYLFLDKSDDAQLRENVFVKIADIYVEHQNYDAAGMLLKESQIEGLYDKYCNETFDLTVYEGAYQDSENEDYFYLGSYPQTGYAIDEVPEYVANADVDAEGYVEVYGVKYIRIDDVFYAYEPVKWWIIGTEGSGYCCLSECIIDTKSFDTAFGPITWDVCSLKEWLNGDFYNNCFDEKEKECLINYMIPASNNYYHQIISGADSYNDVGVIPAPSLSDKTYIFIDHNSDEMRALRKAKGTDYALGQGLKADAENYGRWWTATSADKDNLYTIVVTEAGIILVESGGEVNNKNDVGVRPFIKVSKEDINAAN